MDSCARQDLSERKKTTLIHHSQSAPWVPALALAVVTLGKLLRSLCLSLLVCKMGIKNRLSPGRGCEAEMDERQALLSAGWCFCFVTVVLILGETLVSRLIWIIDFVAGQSCGKLSVDVFIHLANSVCACNPTICQASDFYNLACLWPNNSN